MPFKCNEQECRVVVILVGHQTKQIIVSALEMEDGPQSSPLRFNFSTMYADWRSALLAFAAWRLLRFFFSRFRAHPFMYFGRTMHMIVHYTIIYWKFGNKSITKRWAFPGIHLDRQAMPVISWVLKLIRKRSEPESMGNPCFRGSDSRDFFIFCSRWGFPI